MFTKTAPLGQPLDLAEGLTLKNRVVMASLTRNRSPRVNGQPRHNSHVVEYYRQRARGDFGLILSEGGRLIYLNFDGCSLRRLTF